MRRATLNSAAPGQGWAVCAGLLTLLVGLWGAESKAQGEAPADPPPAEAAREAEMFGSPSEMEREAEMFGDPAPEDTPAEPASETPPQTPSQTPAQTPPEPREASPDRPALAAEPLPAFDRPDWSKLRADPLDIGGRLLLRLESTFTEDTDPEDQPLVSANLLDVYLDTRLSDRVRAYARGRLLYTPTATTGAQSGSDGLTSPLAALGGQTQQTQLDQLWLRFDAAHTVFFTVGAQPVRWGVGRVWNPTDFVNRRFRDPLALADLRTGITAIKAHVPFESSGANLYALALLDGASQVGDVGGALRGELVAGTAEMAVSAAAQRDAPTRLGADLSAALGPFDLKGEVVALEGLERASVDPLTGLVVEPWLAELPAAPGAPEGWVAQAVGGFEIGIDLNDEDTLWLGAEYFYNGAGIDQTEAYPALLLTGNFQPFYVGRHYAALYALAAQPGDWDDVTLAFTTLANLSDQTGVARLNLSFQTLTWLYVEPFVAGRFGPAGGEFRLSLTLPEAGPLSPAVASPAPLGDVGVWLRATL